MDELVSVVIPAYNVSRFIDTAISSVLDQTYRNVEIIVVDDCSTDGTTNEITKFKDKVRFVRHEINQGAAAARNTGINVCRGELVAFLDGDDKWAPGKLEIFADSFSKNPEVLFAFSDFSRFKWSDGSYFALSNSQIFPMIFNILQRYKYRDRKCFVIPKADMFRLLLEGYPIFPSAIVVRKRIFESVGMWRKVRTNEDFDFGLRSCRKTDFLYIDENLAMVGRHDANLTIDTHRQKEGDICVFDLHLADPSYGKDEKEAIRYYRGKRLCGIGRGYLQSGNTKNAIGKYIEALQNGHWFWHALVRIGYVTATGFLRSSSSSSRSTSR
jgi:glycosyltransferase involved in cell wall biosynthesis